ncbi:hypothetical protein KY284_006585 [Solanum tuberosum]|nr:hypothetical protein KY284_006585 [Solanum tuberosum]
MFLPTQAQAPASHALMIISTKALYKLNAAGECTILEERQLYIDGPMSEYLAIWDMIQFHKFEGFIKPQNPYVSSWV